MGNRVHGLFAIIVTCVALLPIGVIAQTWTSRQDATVSASGQPFNLLRERHARWRPWHAPGGMLLTRLSPDLSGFDADFAIDGQLFAFDEFTNGDVAVIAQRPDAGPSGTAAVARLAPSGEVRWAVTVDWSSGGGDVIVTPAGDVLFASNLGIGTSGGLRRVMLLRGGDGAPLRIRQLGGDLPDDCFPRLVTGTGRLIVACTQAGRYVALRALSLTGSSDWSIPLPLTAAGAYPVSIREVAGGNLEFVAVQDSALRFGQIAAATGALGPVGELTLPGNYQTIVHSNASRYFIKSFGAAGIRLSLLDVAASRLVWTVERPGDEPDLFALSDGRGAMIHPEWSATDEPRVRVSLFSAGTGAETGSFVLSGYRAIQGPTAQGRPRVTTSGQFVFSAQRSPDATGVPMTIIRLDASARETARFGVTGPGARSASIAVNRVGDIFVAEANGAPPGGLRMRAIDPLDGHVRWDTPVADSDEVLDVQGVVVDTASNTVMMTATGVTADNTDLHGDTFAGAFDASTGVQRWLKESRAPRGMRRALAHGNPSTDSAARFFWSSTEYTIESGFPFSRRSLGAYDARTGAPLWQRADVAGNATANGVIVGRALLAGNDGRVLWGDPAQPLGVRSIEELPSGDFATIVDATAELVVSRLDWRNGTAKWITRYSNAERAVLYMSQRGIADNGDVFVSAYAREIFGSRRPMLLRFAGDTGALRWVTELPRDPGTLSTARQVREAGDRLLVTLLEMTGSTRYSIIELDAATGSVLGVRLQHGAGGGDQDGGAVPFLLRVTDDAQLIHWSESGRLGLATAMTVRADPVAAAVNGDLAVRLQITPPMPTNGLQQSSFTINVDYTGDGVVDDVTARTAFHPGAITHGVACTVDRGACGAATHIGEWRQSLRLESGAHARITGIVTHDATQASTAPISFEAAVEGPFSLRESRLDNNRERLYAHSLATLGKRVGTGHSGSWFDASRSGEGWILQMLPDGHASLVWFTFPPAGVAGEQRWVIAQNGRVDGNRLTFTDVYLASGGRFAAGFDPAVVKLVRWGGIRMEFSDCNFGTLSYAETNSPTPTTRSIQRLTALAGAPCDGNAPPGSAIDATRSGAWFDLARGGEGWVVESIGSGRAVVYWFTYDPAGNLAWVGGSGTLDGNRLVVTDMRRPIGTRFGADFNPADVNLTPWGSLEMTFDGCHNARVRYASTQPGWGSGEYPAIRLTAIGGIGCP
jgi:outer membrane protein assembly factor BamB